MLISNFIYLFLQFNNKFSAKANCFLSSKFTLRFDNFFIVQSDYIHKGQLISECIFDVINFPRNLRRNRTLFRFLGRNLSSFFVGFFGKFKAPKNHSEINWPLWMIQWRRKLIIIIFHSQDLLSRDVLLMFPNL